MAELQLLRRVHRPRSQSFRRLSPLLSPCSPLALTFPVSRSPPRPHESRWWSYELCYGRHMRQFHLEQGTDEKTGKPATRVVTEFILGLAAGSGAPAIPQQATASVEGSRGSAAASAKAGAAAAAASKEAAVAKEAAAAADARFIVPPKDGEADAEYAPSTLELEYGDGTPCDLNGQPRSTTVGLASCAYHPRACVCLPPRRF